MRLSRPYSVSELARETEAARVGNRPKNIGAALSQFADPLGNEFIPLSNDGYPDYVHAENILQRTSHRSGMLFNVQELVSLVHLAIGIRPLAEIQEREPENGFRGDTG